MTRRELLSAAALSVPTFGEKKKSGPPPNVVLIVPDGLAAFMLGCYGNKEIRTPNIDKFAAGGVHFHNAYACTPEPETSRATLLTGRTPAQSGNSPDLSGILSAQGYTSGSSVLGAGDTGHFIDNQQPSKPFLLVVRAQRGEP